MNDNRGKWKKPQTNHLLTTECPQSSTPAPHRHTHRNKDPKMPWKWGKCWRDTPSWCGVQDGTGFHTEGSGVSTRDFQQKAKTGSPLVPTSSLSADAATGLGCLVCFLSLARLLKAGTEWPCSCRSRFSSVGQQLFNSPQGSPKIATAAPSSWRREKLFCLGQQN